MKLYMLLFQIPLSFMLTCNTKPSSKTTTSLHMCTDLYVNGHACVCVCACVYLSVCLSVHPSVSVCVCVSVCVFLKIKEIIPLWWCVLLKMKDPKNQFCVFFFFYSISEKRRKEKKKEKMKKKNSKNCFCFHLIFGVLVQFLFFYFFIHLVLNDYLQDKKLIYTHITVHSSCCKKQWQKNLPDVAAVTLPIFLPCHDNKLNRLQISY